MPVAQSKRSPRSIMLAVGGLLFGVTLAIAVFLFAVPSLEEGGQVESNLGDDVYTLEADEALAEEIAERGPFILPDVADGDRDIFVQHIGDDVEEGWYVFSTRPADSGAGCDLEWDAEKGNFEDPCSERTFPADGEGLKQYPAERDEDGLIAVDLNFDQRPEETTTTVLVTGDPDGS